MDDPVIGHKPLIITAYLDDKERNFRVIRWLLKSICLSTRSSNSSIVNRIFSEFPMLMCFLLLTITSVSIGRVIFVKERADMDTMMTHIGPFMCYIMTIMKYLCLVLHVDDIRCCMDCLEVDWNTVKNDDDHKVMLRNAKIGRFMATSMAAFMHGAVQFYGVTRCLMKNVVEVDNVSVSIRELPYPFYNEILDVRFSPAYEMVLIMQCIAAFIMSGVTIVTCGLMAIFVMHACGQLKILTMWLDDIVDDNGVVENRIVQQKIGFIVEHHLRVINFVSHIEEVIYLTCLVELLGGSLTLCLLGYCSLLAWNQGKKESIPTYCLAAFSFSFNIFIICYIAELLSDQYRQVGTATYTTKWYRLPPKTAIGLLLINMRSNFKVNLTAGKMVDLSLYTFGNVLKAAMTYLNMLRQTTMS